MKDCGYTLRKAYIDKLTTASYSLSVYDTIAPDTVEPPISSAQPKLCLVEASGVSIAKLNEQEVANPITSVPIRTTNEVPLNTLVVAILFYFSFMLIDSRNDPLLSPF